MKKLLCACALIACVPAFAEVKDGPRKDDGLCHITAHFIDELHCDMAECSPDLTKFTGVPYRMNVQALRACAKEKY
jgi:hypothetical protein